MVETQVLIQEIQKKHQITLKPDDPVFVVVTLNDLLLSHYLEKFQAMLEAQNKLVVSEGIERLNQASAMGSEMINRSLEALGGHLTESAYQTADKTISLINERNQQPVQKLQRIVGLLHWSGYITVAFCFFILGMMFKLALPK
jgi:hypothetical protein